MTAWSAFISSHNLNDWFHAYQTKEAEEKAIAEHRPGFRQLYDITMTPSFSCSIKKNASSPKTCLGTNERPAGG